MILALGEISEKIRREGGRDRKKKREEEIQRKDKKE
jgi:hypothetical protein